MNPTTNTKAGAVADVAAKLTEAQRDLLFAIGDGVVDAAIVNSSDGDRLFDNGLRSDILAAGYYFTNLTPLGLAVRQHLEQGATAGVVGGKEAAGG